ncbi:Spermine synthaselike, partial [Caligus rogercresseyi]
SKSEDSSKWNLIESVLTKSIHLLKPDEGKYLTHCNGKNVPDALKIFEEIVQKLQCGFRIKESFVGSFMEIWVFYEIYPLGKSDS